MCVCVCVCVRVCVYVCVGGVRIVGLSKVAQQTLSLSIAYSKCYEGKTCMSSVLCALRGRFIYCAVLST